MVKRYRFKFTGRRKGAIGIFYPIVTERDGVDADAARLALYDEYEHIHGATYEEITRIQRTHTVNVPTDATFKELYQVTRPEWQAFPTLSQGQDADLKYESERYRVWVSRMSLADYDGNTRAYNDEMIQFEELIGGRWELLDRYGKRV